MRDYIVLFSVRYNRPKFVQPSQISGCDVWDASFHRILQQRIAKPCQSFLSQYSLQTKTDRDYFD